MTTAELKLVREELTFVHGIWHQCGLGKADAKAMKLKPGRLCDDCLASVEAAIARITSPRQGDGNV